MLTIGFVHTPVKLKSTKIPICKDSNNPSPGKLDEIFQFQGSIGVVNVRDYNLRQQQCSNLPPTPPPNAVDKMFQDLSVEFLHTANDPNVEVRISLGKHRTSQHNPYWDWNSDIKSVSMHVYFTLSPKHSTDQVESTVFHVNSNPIMCGVPLCPCNGTSFCIRKSLCPLTLFERYIIRDKPNESFIVNAIISAEFSSEVKPVVGNEIAVRQLVLKILGSKMLDEGLQSDFTLICGDKKFPCHKAILAAHSQVFAAMFTSQMAEALSNSMEVPDMKVESVAAFLQYLYKGSLDSPLMHKEIAFALFQTAHKYEIPHLEETVEDILLNEGIDNFDIGTALDMFTFCTQVDKFKNLKDKSVSIIKRKAQSLNESEDFEAFVKNLPNLAKILLVEICLI